jgi:glucokinase
MGKGMTALQKNIQQDAGIKLVADIGGTHARFAVVEDAGKAIAHARTLKTDDFPGIFEAIEYFLEEVSVSSPTSACIAVACPVGEDVISLTNNGWSFSTKNLRQNLSLDELIVVNDFKALARAIPGLNDGDLVQIGEGRAVESCPISVLGPGTGLGVATVAFDEGHPVVLDGEGGHIAFAPTNEREIEICRILSWKYGRVSVERILSGPGLPVLHQALADIDGNKVPILETPVIIERALDGTCPRCVETVQAFTAMLGSFAGDVALLTGSRGGIYLGGGIAPRIRPFLEEDWFRSRFEDKGRMSPLVQKIPTFLITIENPALKGAALLLEQETY